MRPSKNREPEHPAIGIACQIFEGTYSDAFAEGTWDLDDAVDFVLEHMAMGDFEWHSRKEPKPKFSSMDVELEKIIYDALKGYY